MIGYIFAILWRGFAMGAADLVPGVSGGTVAYATGIYGRLIRALRACDLRALGLLLRGRIVSLWHHIDAGFLCMLACGIVLAVIVFTRVFPLPEWVETYPKPFYSAFMLLMLGVVWMLARRYPTRSQGELLFLLCMAACGYMLLQAVPVDWPHTPLNIGLSGMIAISALLLPGVSGSYILLVLGKYSVVVAALGVLDMAIVLPFAIGAALGIIIFSRLLSYLLEAHEYRTHVAINGLIIGTLPALWAFEGNVFDVLLQGWQMLLTI